MKQAVEKNINLLFALMRMYFKLNDYRNFLGFLWSFIGPLMTFGVLYYIFRDSFGRQIPLFGLRLFAGIFVLNFFLSVVQISMSAVFSTRELALNNRVPYAILLAAPLCIPLLKFTVELSLCLIIAYFSKVFLWVCLPKIILLTVLFSIFSFGAGLCLGLLNGLAADIGEIWQRITPLFFFITPLFYSMDSIVGTPKQTITACNPLTPFILGFQQIIASPGASILDRPMLVQIFLYSGIMITLGSLLFKKMYSVTLER